MRPSDLFQLRQVGEVAWSSDGRYASIEFSRPGAAIGNGVPTNEIALLDVKTHALRVLTSPAQEYIGFFNATFSPNSRQLAYLSVDHSAAVRVWVYTIGQAAPAMLPELDARTGFGEAPVTWLSNGRLLVSAWDAGADKSGDLYFNVLRGRNAAELWKRAYDAKEAAVSVVESRGPRVAAPTGRLVVVNPKTLEAKTLARGPIHHVTVSSDRRVVSYFQEDWSRPIADYFDPSRDVEAAYAAVNWGTERHVISATTGEPVDLSQMANVPAPPTPQLNIPLPRADARRLSLSPTGDTALFIANASGGSHLWLSGSSKEIWHANEWVREIAPGQAQRLDYKAGDGTPLIAWLLLPHDHNGSAKLPMITMIYPGTTYRDREPSSFSIYTSSFEHPQLFAALGYAVLMAGMPAPKDPTEFHSMRSHLNGVMPAVDAAVATGIIDPDRIAVQGQSNGGFAVLSLITQTNRFRSAISSAGFSDLTSLYGVFYGQYRYGDSGPPVKAQLLRMLQMERGEYAYGGPPWAFQEPSSRYLDDSPIRHVADVHTPIMMIAGEQDFVPIQQAEECFTAMLRQDKRAELVRYQGEWHTIANRANVLDMWKRIEAWLGETMAAR